MIEESLTVRGFFAGTGQALMQDWLVALVRGLVSRLPVGLMMKLGLATLFRPRTRGWDAASAAIEEYVEECEAAARKALRLDVQGAE